MGASLGGTGGGESETAVVVEGSGDVDNGARVVSGVELEVSKESMGSIGGDDLRDRFGFSIGD